MKTHTATLNKQITIQYWLNDNVPEDISEELDEQCKARIFEMMNNGYQSGELCESYDEQTYYGWWNRVEVNLVKPKDKTMQKILKLIGNTQRDEAIEMLKNSKFDFEDLFVAMTFAGMSNQMIGLIRGLIAAGYINPKL
jgi:hypothetical protein